jgi:hypothetical protein
VAALIELKPGEVFAGHYRVKQQLAQGGMGALYVVEHERTGKRCALKLMLPEIVEMPGMRKRFELEAKVGSRIESDHVVDVVDAGVDAATGAPWLAMELLDGEDLAACVQRMGPLPPADVREYAARGWNQREYPWGSAMLARLGKDGWGFMYDADDGAEATSPVGKYPDGASPFGMLDMAGNVGEWVADWWAHYEEPPAPPWYTLHADSPTPVVNPQGPSKAYIEQRRVIRGGGWRTYEASYVRSASRGTGHVTDRRSDVGFRCARGPNK